MRAASQFRRRHPVRVVLACAAALLLGLCWLAATAGNGYAAISPDGAGASAVPVPSFVRAEQDVPAAGSAFAGHALATGALWVAPAPRAPRDAASCGRTQACPLADLAPLYRRPPPRFSSLPL